MNETLIQRLTAVANTLSGATIRADQIDAIQRINACVRELHSIMADVSKPAGDEKKEA